VPVVGILFSNPPFLIQHSKQQIYLRASACSTEGFKLIIELHFTQSNLFLSKNTKLAEVI